MSSIIREITGEDEYNVYLLPRTVLAILIALYPPEFSEI